MRKQIRWTDKLEDGVRKDIRVSIQAHSIKWQFKRSDAAAWDYDTPPTAAEWDSLEQRLLDRYQRGHTGLEKELALVRRQRGIATGKA